MIRNSLSRTHYAAIYAFVAFAARCRQQEIASTNDTLSQKGLGSHIWFCQANLLRCRNTERIVNDANRLSGTRFYFPNDPCTTDGQRDAFRHIYSMAWITHIYGMTFANSISDYKDPPPENESDPQIRCQRQMDRTNNTYGMIHSRSLMNRCAVGEPGNFRTYTDYLRNLPQQRSRRNQDCVGNAVYEAIISSSATDTNGPVVINRNRNDATVCRLLASSSELLQEGRTGCEKPSY